MGRQRAPSCRQNEALHEKRSEKSVFRGRCALTPRFAATVLSIITIICIFLFFFPFHGSAPPGALCPPPPERSSAAVPVDFHADAQFGGIPSSFSATQLSASRPKSPLSSGIVSVSTRPTAQRGGKSVLLSRWDAGAARSLSETKSSAEAWERGGLSPAALIPLWGGSGRSGSGCVQCRGEGKKKLRKKKKKNSSPLGPIPSPPAAPSSSTWLAQVFHVNDSNKYLIMSRSHRRLAEQPALMRHPGDVGRGGGGRRKRRKLARSKVFSALV